MFTVAAAPFRIPKALTTGSGMRSWGWLMSKLPRELLQLIVNPGLHCISYGMIVVVLPLRLRTPVLVRRDLFHGIESVLRTIRWQ